MLPVSVRIDWKNIKQEKNKGIIHDYFDISFFNINPELFT
jgi:hypothetical protein